MHRVLSLVRRIVGYALLALVAVVVLWHAYVAVKILWWRDHAPRETAFMSQRLSELRTKDPNARLRYEFVPMRGSPRRSSAR